MMTGGQTEIRLLLPSTPEAAATAREAMTEFAGSVDEETLQNLRLLVSELVTNAYRHSRMRPDEQILLRAHRPSRSAVRVEVGDPGAGFAKPATPTPREDSGWGLYLVDHLSSRWGVERGRGTSVWFEIDTA